MESASRWYSSKTLASPPSCRRLSSRWTTSSRRRGSRRNRISMRAVPSSDGPLEVLAASQIGEDQALEPRLEVGPDGRADPVKEAGGLIAAAPAEHAPVEEVGSLGDLQDVPHRDPLGRNRQGVAALAAAGGAHEAPADQLLEDLGDEAAGEILGAGDLLDSRRARRLVTGQGDHHRHPIEALLREESHRTEMIL